MKNLSIILNAVLLVAVGVLYYLHFSGNAESPTPKEPTALSPETTEPNKSSDTVSLPEVVELPDVNTNRLKIAYINLDELYDKYEFYKHGVARIEKSREDKINQFQEKQKKFQEDVMNYQQMAASLTENHRKTKEQQLAQQEQELYQLREKLAGDEMTELTKFQEDLLKKIDDYLKNLSKEKNYTYIFTYMKGGPSTLVYANDSLDITRQVIQGLNKGYKK